MDPLMEPIDMKKRTSRCMGKKQLRWIYSHAPIISRSWSCWESLWDPYYSMSTKALLKISHEYIFMSTDLKLVNYHGFTMLQSEAAAVGPYFSNTVRMRVNKKKATNIVFTGEAGVGKSYMAMQAARIIEGRYKTTNGTWKDRFTIDQVVFNFSDFMELVMTLKSGKIIIFDEPSYAIGKREWYKKLNQALTKTIESFRFKVHPLFLPVINKGLLDKTIRDHLVQFQVNVTDRGKATVYRLRPSQFKEKTYHESFCELHYGMMDMDQCQKNHGAKPRKSCLSCKQIETCQVFRAQYERKKRDIQDLSLIHI